MLTFSLVQWCIHFENLIQGVDLEVVSSIHFIAFFYFFYVALNILFPCGYQFSTTELRLCQELEYVSTKYLQHVLLALNI